MSSFRQRWNALVVGAVVAADMLGYGLPPLAVAPDAVLPDGGRYTGETRGGRLHGEGVYTTADGYLYRGTFRDGRLKAVATRTSLERTLEHVAAKMNAGEDILFLYLTSHGSRDHALAVEQPGMDLPDLRPETLGRLLGDLDQRWRVVGVSACYAGGFIEPLRGPGTLVMTAALADRTSFGRGGATRAVARAAGRRKRSPGPTPRPPAGSLRSQSGLRRAMADVAGT